MTNWDYGKMVCEVCGKEIPRGQSKPHATRDNRVIRVHAACKAEAISRDRKRDKK